MAVDFFERRTRRTNPMLPRSHEVDCTHVVRGAIANEELPPIDCSEAYDEETVADFAQVDTTYPFLDNLALFIPD